MPIVIGLGDDSAWNDPLNVYGGKPTSAKPETARPAALNSGDWNDVVNTVIAEAAGEGDDGMAAVASVIRNRADLRGKSAGDIVRQPKQFTGYEAPGSAALKAMQDPAVRARAESIIGKVFAGDMPDPTGGADHYHADYVSPDWAASMPKTATIGRHVFYRDGKPVSSPRTAYTTGLDAENAPDPFAAVLRGDQGRQVSSPLKNASNDGDVLLSKLQAGKPQSYIADLHGDMRTGLTSMFTEAPDFVREGLDILSGARTPEKQAQIIADNAGKYGFSAKDWMADVKAMGPVEAGQKWRPTFRQLGMTRWIGMPGGSKHQTGEATDLGWKGGNFSAAPKEVRDWVHANAGRYGLAFPLSNEPWHIETAGARGAEAHAGAKTDGSKVGRTIVIGADFQSSDPMGLMADGNPFQAIADEKRATAQSQAADVANGIEQRRINALNDQHNAEIGKLAGENPTRYELVDQDKADAWQQKWDEDNRSSGRVGDFIRNWGIGAGQASDSISNLNELLISKLPGGDWINQKLNDIERWMGSGKTIAEVRKEANDKLAATRTERGQDAAEKTVFQKDSWALGDALTDPDWYLAQIAQSLPSTLVTMAPSGVLARGAFATAVASGSSEMAAAAAAAKMATVAGGVTEGILGGAQSALSIKEKIAAIPREQLVASDAVQKLIADGKTEDEAIRAVTDDAQVQGLITAGVATGIFGGMGDRTLAKIIGEGVGGNIARRTATGAVRGMVGEGIFEEMPQNVAQTVAENAAMRRVKPDQDLFEGGAEAAVSGLAAGGAMGGAMGGVGGAMSPRRAAGAEASDIGADGNGQGPAAASATTQSEAATEPKGPIARSVRHAEEQIATKSAGDTAIDGRPEVGASVRVDADGIKPIMGQVEGYEGDEAVVIDNSSGEVYQIPIANITKVADAIGTSVTTDASAQSINDSIPEFSSDPALEPASPRAAETTTEPLPPASEQKPAAERFPTAPQPGERVIVDDKNGGRFPAKVKSWETGGTEAVVTTDDGKDLQVPVTSLAVSKLTKKEVEAQDAKREPAVDRTEEREAAKGPTSRTVAGRMIVMPDERHARLYDLGADRTMTKRMLGASQLDLAGVNNPELRALADEFKVTPQAIEAMADDYRYRVEKAARDTQSDMPQHVAPVNGQRLALWQRQRANANPESGAQEQTAAIWWNGELNAQERKRILAAAGVKRSERMMWAGFTPAIRAKLEPFRVQADEKQPVDDTAAAVDKAAHEAATSPTNDHAEPSQAQKEAGNYKLGHIQLGGLDISIENPAGSQRKGVDPDGKPWSVEMKSHYGYIKGTVGRDKDHIDVFVKTGTEELDDTSPVFVVDQNAGNGAFDEHKVMIGFDSEAAARDAYLENYSDDWQGLRDITRTTLATFKRWTKESDTTKPFAQKWFGSRQRAEAYIKREGLSASHEAVETNRRFQVKEKASGAAARNVRVGDDGAAGAQSAGTHRTDPESAANGNSGRSQERGRVDAGSSVADGREDVPSANRDANTDKALTPSVDVSKYPWNDVWGSDADAISDGLSALSATNGGDQPIVDLVRSGASDRDLLNYIGSAWGIGGTGGNRYMVETSAGPTVTFILDKDGGKERVVLKGPKLAKALRREFDQSLAEMKDKAERKQDAPASEQPKTKPAVSENKIFTADAAERARALLRSKLNQLNSGIDPEIMQAGITLAGYHIERGARTFAAYAGAMLADLGEVARPYLKSWYMGVKYDPRATAFDGMSSAAEVDAADVNTIGGNDEPAKLEDDGAGTLEGIPAGTVSPAEGSRDTGRGSGSGGRADVSGSDAAGSKRVQPGRGLANDAGDLPSAAGNAKDGSSKPDTAGDGSHAQRATDDADPVTADTFVPAPNGSLDFGEITPGMANEIRRQPGKIRLQHGNDKFGRQHIEKRHGAEIRAAGYGSIEHFVSDVAANLTEIWKPEGSGQLIAVRQTKNARLLFVELKPGRDEAGDFYTVNTAFPARAGFLEKKGWKKLWEGRAQPSSSASSTQTPFAASPQNAGEAITIPSGQSSFDSDSDATTDTAAKNSRVTGRQIETSGNIAQTSESVQSAAISAQQVPADFAISADDRIGQGGAKTKFRNNVDAIKLLAKLNEEQRPATRSEQSILAKWVGWGGLREAFYREDGTVNKGWEKQAEELKALLTPEEYRAAEASTRNAHYTAPEVVSAMWNIARRLGFTGGQVLEPSVGAGNFLGLMPSDVRDAARVTGVELDHITGGIAKNLYPGANIQAPVGFETFSMPDGYFDLAIGNPPFGSERVYDKSRRHLNKLSIHNFFFAKSIEGLRPGGVLAMVVTNRFLDGNNAAARNMIASNADLIGAIRLPNNAFLKNAGTEVTTDIVLLQKRAEGAESSSTKWTETAEWRGKDGKSVPLNRYFIEHPDMMLGDFGAYGTMYGPDEPALIAPSGQDLPSEIAKAIDRLPAGIMPRSGTAPVVAKQAIAGVEDVHVGSMFSSGGQVYQRLPDSLGKPQSTPVQFPSDTAKERVAGMVHVRDVFAKLRQAQIDDGASETRVQNLRTMLNKAYDSFVRKHGPINADANKRLFRDDPTWPQISALENNFDRGISPAVARKTGEKARAASADKAPIFARRTQQPYHPPVHAGTAKDALAQTLNERGRVDMDYMSTLYGKPEAEIAAELGPLLYRTPQGAYAAADAYLSGNVKAKLAEAERAAETDTDFRRNVAALRDVIPPDIEPVDIDVKPGAPWVPGAHVADFIRHITGSGGASAVYSKAQGQWVLDVPRPIAAADVMWGTSRAPVSQIVSAALNGKSTQVYTKDAEGNSVLDQPATDAANEKVERVKAEWQRWIWDDDSRREELARLYNDTFNTDVVRVYDGSHLTLPGKVSDDIITLRPHQKSFVWRTLQSPVALADHTVGAGKTFALIASIMEKRRTGQARKPLLTVPNHLVGQWAADFVKLYPGAKVLAATKRDFEKDNRKRLMARITTGDWDAVIIAHSQFGLVGVSPEVEAKFIEGQIADMEASIRDLRQQTGEKSRNVSQLAKQRQNLETKLKSLLDAGRKDDGLYFDDLGVDALYVDEFHEFKNLPFVTGMQRVAGLGNPTGSKKATDMYIKVQQVLERTGGNIVVATGTPLSNTMAEMYTLMRYLAGKVLQRLGLSHFDAWARVFGDVVTDWELSPSGQYKLNTRFARFVNIPELMTQYLGFADVISNDDIKAQLAAQGKTLPLPKVKGGKPTNITVERSPDQAAFIGEGRTLEDGRLEFPTGSLVYRAEHLPKKAEKGADNMLKVMSDARKAALDMRLIDPSYGDYAGSKINRAADEMKRIYDKWHAERGTQLVFIDLSTPKKAKVKEEAALRDLIKRAEDGDEAAQEKLDAMSPDEFTALDSAFSVYDDLRQKLIDRGVPASEIAFIHDANTELQKEELFGKVRSGRVRFLLGSTPKMGAGTNVQNRLVGLHHLDAPWRPSDLEQRDGRIIRQGNELYAADPDGFEVEILRYATKNTLDARQWQGIEAKARFIGQVRKGDVKTRVVEDIAGEAANAAEMKAAASGNPLILEEMDTRRKLRQLEAQAIEHEREQHRIKGKIRDVEAEREMLEQRQDAVKQDAKAAGEFASKPFSAEVNGNTVEKPKEFGAALLAMMRQAIIDGTEHQAVGSIGGFNLAIDHNYSANFTVEIAGARSYNITVSDVSEQDATGLAMQVINSVKRLQNLPQTDAERIGELVKQRPALEKQIGPWSLASELKSTAEKHLRLIEELKPKAKPAAAIPANAGTQEELLQPLPNKRRDPVVRIRDTLQSEQIPERKDNETVMQWARRLVLAPGARTGHEYLVAIDDDGTPVEFGTSGMRDDTGMSKRLAGAMNNPDRRLVVFHNHPRNTPISSTDISALVFRGVHSIWALGAQGQDTRVAPTDRFNRWRDNIKSIDDANAQQAELIRALRDANAQAFSFLQSEVNAGRVTEKAAQEAMGHIASMVAQKAGILEYFNSSQYAADSVSGLPGLIDTAAGILEKAVFNETSTQADNAGLRRPAKPLRHIAEVDGLAETGSGVAGKHGGPRGLSEGGPRDYPKAQRGAVTEQKIIRELKGRLTDLQPSLLKIIPLNYFVELARPNMKSVAEYLRIKRLMDAFRGQKHADADEIAGAWLKYSRLGFLGKDKSRAQALADLMHESTLLGIDPTATDEETRARFEYDALRKKYMELPPSGRDLYQRVRDAYKAQAEELDDILLENVRKTQRIAANKAEDRYKNTLQKIRDAGLPPLERRKAEEDAESAYKAEKTKSAWAAKARMTKMRIAFESTRVEPPYFPLGRFGRYFVTLRDVDGSVVSFSKFERAADRDRFVRDVESHPHYNFKVEKGVMEQGADLRRAMDPRMVAEIETLLGDAGVKPEIMDMIWQRYLETMPDLSTRKNFIHRKGTRGFNRDALRVFSSHMFHAAHQMARVKYGAELQELVNQTKEEAREADDQTRAMTLANELSNRHEWVMNPTGGKLAQYMTSAAFVWYMGASPAAAVVNMAQTYMMGVPILGARLGGVTKAADALLKASIVNNENLSGDERNALETFMSSGLIDRTQSHDLAGVGETGTEYSPLRARVMWGFSLAFHKAEVWNRRTVAIAAYRLARRAGQNHMQAIDTAHELTWKTHFDYSNSSRPTLMQKDYAKVALVFRQYDINMLYRVFRDVQQSIAGETAKARHEARYQLAGIVGMMALFGGITGTFGFNIAMALAGMVFGDDDDPLEFAERFKADVVDILGPELGGIVLNGAAGHYTGIDLSSRVGKPDLWWRSPTQELEGKEEYSYWVMQSLGATISVGNDWYRGINLIREGEVARGVEAAAPKFIRDLMKAYRYHNEGLTTINGDEMMSADQIGLHGAIAQAFGFMPAAVSETWERNSALKNAEKRLLDDRQRLVNKWAMAAIEGDRKGVEKAISAIVKWNGVSIHQPIAITKETLERSIKTRAANKAKRQDGTLIKNEVLGIRLRGALAERIY